MPSVEAAKEMASSVTVAGGRLAAINRENAVHLVAAREDGRLVHYKLSSDQINEGEPVANAGPSPGSCHPVSRVALILRNAKVTLLYQTIDASIALRSYDETSNSWSAEEPIIPANAADEPLFGTSVALSRNQVGGHTIFWQTTQGDVVRRSLDDNSGAAVSTGVHVQLGTSFRALSRQDGKVEVYWLDKHAGVVRKAKGDPASSGGTFETTEVYEDWSLRGFETDFAVVAERVEMEDAVMFYSVDHSRRCIQWDSSGMQKRTLSRPPTRIGLRDGLATIIIPATAESFEMAAYLFYYDTRRKQAVLVRRNAEKDFDWDAEQPLPGTEEWGATDPLQHDVPEDDPKANTSQPLIVFANGDGNASEDSQSNDGKVGDRQATSGRSGGGGHDEKGVEADAAPAPLSSWIFKTCKDKKNPGSKSTANASTPRISVPRPVGESERGKKPYRAVIANRDRLWQSNPQQIRYHFLDGTPKQHDKVTQAIDEWTWYANVQFIQERLASEAHIRIKFDPNDGSWSYVGTECKDIHPSDATMNLAWLDRYSDMTNMEKAVILHEFGHALGLLHEHQSPAHGGVAVKNIDLALQMYRDSDGWCDEQIYDQVIRVYEGFEVSNYSQVDHQSIMQYMQPKELTGLDYDIPYRTKLSQLDKAYMVLQYPRPRPHPKAAEWTIEHALDVIGCPKEVSEKVLEYVKTDLQPDGVQIDPSRIREVIGDWARKAHTPPPPAPIDHPSSGVEPSRTTNPMTKDDAAVEKRIQAFLAKAPKADLAEAAPGDKAGSMCDTDKQTAAKSSSGSKKPAHAVIKKNALLDLPTDASTFDPIKITYGFTPDYFSQPSPHQRGMFRTACAAWSRVAHVEFVELTSGLAGAGVQPDLLVCFHDNAADPKLSGIDPDSGTRSVTALPVAARNLASWKRYRETDDFKDWSVRSGYPRISWDILYFGIFRDADEAEKWHSANRPSLNGLQLNLRSLIHELGHFLGLDHEQVGLYAAWMQDGTFRGSPDLSKLVATKYDTSSVMDVMGITVPSTMARILKYKGLGPAEVEEVRSGLVGLIGGATKRVKLALTLSKFDEANIALLYPGATNLVEPRRDHTSVLAWQLTKDQDTGRDRLEVYLESLMVDLNHLPVFKSLLENGQWAAARQAYIAILEGEQQHHYDTRDTFDRFIADQIKAEKKDGLWNVFFAPKKQSATRAAHAPLHAPSVAADQPGTAKKPEGPFIKVLYDKLLSFFPPGNAQYFALQFPTRFLDKESFAYDTSGIFSRFEKPVVVNEAEFALTDALYPPGPLVGGPNGQSLSANYVKLLNALCPSYDGNEARQQREKMRAWLLTQTHAADAAFTIDSRLAIPGLDQQTALSLSASSGVRVLPSDKATTMSSGLRSGNSGPTKPLSAPDPSKPSVSLAQNALRGVADDGLTVPRRMTRMEFAESLTLEYLNDRMEWELRRDDMIREAEAQEDSVAMEAVTRRLARISGVENAKLATKYADAVVRGHSHTVRELMGHLDVRTTAELLQDAKDSLRESALSSLYTASEVYPVQMQPADWFQALDTGFTREDLSQSSDLLDAAIRAKSSQIDNFETQIANLRGFATVDPAKAKAAVAEAAKAQEDAMASLSAAYTESTISAVKLALQAAAAATPAGAAGSVAAATAESALSELKGRPDGDKDKSKLKAVLGDDFEKLDDIGKQIDGVTKANAAVNSASRRLTAALSQSALAQAGDTKLLVENLQRKLSSAKQELQDMRESYTIAVQKESKAKAAGEELKSSDEVGTLPSGAAAAGGGTRWTELSLVSEVSNATTDTSSMASSSASSWSCNFWLGSYGSSSSESSASVSSNTASDKLKVDVSMRTTYVTVDRSGWFSPSLAEMSASFMHSVEDGSYTPWSRWPSKEKKVADGDSVSVQVPLSGGEVVDRLIAGDGKGANVVSGYLTVYPIGFVLVKDCVIKITSSALLDAAAKSNFEKQSASSGGFLCFSHSNSSHSSGDTSRSSMQATSDGFVIRVPGPQILGYMMQLMPPDLSTSFKTMPDDYLFKEMDRIAAEEDRARLPRAAHMSAAGGASGGGGGGMQPTPTNYESSSARRPGVREYDLTAPSSGAGAGGGSSSSSSVATASAPGPAGSQPRPASAASPPSRPPLAKLEDTLHDIILSSPELGGRDQREREDLFDALRRALVSGSATSG